jgi:hypothetical protein
MPRSKVNGITKYLSPRHSRGFLEPKAGEFVRIDDELFYIKFLTALLREEEELRSIACIPDSRLCFYQHVRHGSVHVLEPRKDRCPRPGPDYELMFNIRAGVLITLQTPILDFISGSEPRLWVPESIHDAIQRCRELATRFCILNLGILYSKDIRVGHSHSLVLDLKNNLLENYNPNGKAGRYTTMVRRLLEQAFPEFKYVGDGPKIGVQQRADAFQGLCSTYAAMYVLMRLKNPHLTKRQVENLMIRGSPEELRSRALRFNAYMAEKLRQYKEKSLV